MIELTQCGDGKDRKIKTERLAKILNENGFFVRGVNWRGKTMLRFSIMSQNTSGEDIERLGDMIAASVWEL